MRTLPIIVINLLFTRRSNILLDIKLNARISDFGFTIQMPKSVKNTTIVSSGCLSGTNGYKAPEYGELKFSIKSDVFSFGVVS